MNDHPYGWLSLLPPLVAISLAIVTRRIVLSLVVGIFAGALLMARGDLLLAVHHTWETHLWNTLIDAGKLRVFSFTLLMGALVGVITRSGGMQGFIRLLAPWANSRRRGQLATWVLGLLVFFDDYANTILLGSTLRPICDRLRISREKLAYLVDSTAAPVAGVALVSTWVAVEIDYIASGLEAISDSNLRPFELFLATIPYRFYVLGALFLVPLTALLGRDLGAMWRAEQLTAAGEASPGRIELVDEDDERRATAWYHAVAPILLTLALVVLFIYQTGASSLCASRAQEATDQARALLQSQGGLDLVQSTVVPLQTAAADGDVAATQAAIAELGQQVSQALPESQIAWQAPSMNLRDVVGAADSSLALQYGALAGLALAMVMAWSSRLLSAEALISAAMAGAGVVLPAVVILWTASTMSRMTTDTSATGEVSTIAYQFQDHRLYTADFLSEVIAGDEEASGEARAHVSTRLLPTMVFVLAAVVAFCTGTSWGTMGILVPMVVQTAYTMLAREAPTVSPQDPILLSSIAGVLAGAVFGDHCSPISDTTVLSSQACGCDHIAHVWTQMPYALIVAVVSIGLGTVPIGFGVSVWLLLPLQMLALIVLLRLLGRRVPPLGTPEIALPSGQSAASHEAESST